MAYPVAADVFAALTDGVDDVLASHQNDRGDAIENIEAYLGTNASQTTPTGANRVLASTSGTASTWTASPTLTSLTLTTSLALNSGGVITFNGGDVTETHSANTLTWAGATSGYVFNDGNITASTGTLNIGSSAYSLFSDAGGFSMRSNNGASAASTLYLDTNSAHRVIVDYVGNVKVAGSAVRATTEGTNHLDIFDGTAPIGTLANGISLYSTAGELRVMDAAGNPTLLSPHDDNNNWIFESYVGKGNDRRRIIVDMEKMMRAINQKFGWDFIHEFVI